MARRQGGDKSFSELTSQEGKHFGKGDIRRSVFGYSILDQQHGYSAILHNLAGFMCFLILKANPRDSWCGTKINPSGGEIKQPQHIDSWLIGHLLNYIIEAAHKQATMSEVQQQRVRDAMRKNPCAPGLRFRELDKRIVVSDLRADCTCQRLRNQ